MKLELFKKDDMVFNVLIVVLIIVFLLQLLGGLDISKMLSDPVCQALFLVLLTYVADKEIVVGLLLAMVYLLMYNNSNSNSNSNINEGFANHEGQSSGTGSSVGAESEAESDSGSGSSVSVKSDSESDSGSGSSVSAQAESGSESGSSVNSNESKEDSAKQGFVDAVDPLKLQNIMEQMNSLGIKAEPFTNRSDKQPKSVQSKIDNIRQNLGKIQSTIGALKNTPTSL